MGQKKKTSGFVFLMQRAAYIFTLLMVGAFPLFYRNGYIDILRAKLAFFRTCFWAFVIVILFLGILEFFHRDNRIGSLNGKLQTIILSKWDAETIFVIIFILSIMLSTAFSPYPAEAWKGMEGRRLGGEMMMLCVVMYLMVARLLRPDKGLVYVLLISNTLVFGLGILNFWGIDILHMYGNLASRQHDRFISTIGNVNANASYLCLILPVVMVLYIQSESLWSKLSCGAFLILGFYEAYTTISDSWILGIGTSYLVLLWYSLKGNRQMKRFLELCGLFWVSSLILKFTLRAGEIRDACSSMFLKFQKLKLQNQMLEEHILLAAGLLLACLWLFVHILEWRGASAPYHFIKRVFFAVIAAVLAVGVMLAAIANFSTGWKGKVKWLKRFKLKDRFGTNRGYVWKRTVRAWVKLPIQQKLFGYGLNCFQQFIDVDYGKEIRQRFKWRFVDAHNEFLQFLVTTGILGVTAYFGMIISAAWSAAKASKDKPIMLMGTAALGGFLAQGLVNNPTGFITPSLFLFLGILRSLRKSLDNLS